jgi:hypothetical protein
LDYACTIVESGVPHSFHHMVNIMLSQKLMIILFVGMAIKEKIETVLLYTL